MCAGLKGATGRLSVFGHFVGRVEVLGIEPRAFAMSYFPTPLFFFFKAKVSLCSSGCPGSHYVAQAGLELEALLQPQAPICWGYRRAPPRLAPFI